MLHYQYSQQLTLEILLSLLSKNQIRPDSRPDQAAIDCNMMTSDFFYHILSLNTFNTYGWMSIQN